MWKSSNFYLRKVLKCIFLFFLIFILVFVFQLELQAQDFRKEEVPNLFEQTPTHSLNFVILLGLAQKGHIDRLEGNEQVKSNFQPNFEGGIDYQHRLHRMYWLGGGIHLVATGRNLVYHVPVEKINPDLYQEPYPPTKFTDFDIGVAIPFFLERQWNLRADRSIYAQLGVQIHYSFETDISYGDSYIDTTNNYIEVFHLDLNTNNKNKSWITLSFGSGYQWTLKNRNLFKFGFATNLSFSHYTNGVYQISIPGESQTSGNYHVNGSYIALVADYCLTGQNRKLLKKYETQRTL